MSADLQGEAAVGVIWLSMSELARQKGIKRQSLHERINRLERDGLIVSRRKGRSRHIDVAAYDRAVGQVGDEFKEQSADTRRDEPLTNSPKLRDAQADKAVYDARLKALDYGERIGNLVPRRGEHGIETALIKISEVILLDMGDPINWASDMMEAARKSEHDLRRLLRQRVHELREKIAKRLLTLASEAESDSAGGVQVNIDFED
jgi:DNA-binding Lrp family transcriptional regulator